MKLYGLRTNLFLTIHDICCVDWKSIDRCVGGKISLQHNKLGYPFVFYNQPTFLTPMMLQRQCEPRVTKKHIHHNYNLPLTYNETTHIQRKYILLHGLHAHNVHCRKTTLYKKTNKQTNKIRIERISRNLLLLNGSCFLQSHEYKTLALSHHLSGLRSRWTFFGLHKQTVYKNKTSFRVTQNGLRTLYVNKHTSKIQWLNVLPHWFIYSIFSPKKVPREQEKLFNLCDWISHLMWRT